MNFELENIYGLMLTFTRTGALMLAVPVLGGNIVPTQIRVALGLLLAVAMMPLTPEVNLYGAKVTTLALNLLFELFVGILMGLAVQGVFSCINFASETITNEIGLLRSESFDPSSSSGAGTGLGALFYYFSLTVFLTLGIHRDVIHALAQSFQALPAGCLNTSGVSFNTLMHVTNQIFIIGLLMSAPFIAINFLVNTTFSLLGKVAPKMNVFVVSFSVRILAGISALSFTATLLAHYMGSEFYEIPNRMLDMVLRR